ncbi:MAG: hypothetical protein Q8Q42_00530 [Nanoarchaeota archaeon]|nr:hypothetical protein [Nanoarchaeota archaeon]
MSYIIEFKDKAIVKWMNKRIKSVLGNSGRVKDIGSFRKLSPFVIEVDSKTLLNFVIKCSEECNAKYRVSENRFVRTA